MAGELVSVLVTDPIGDELLHRIGAVNPRVKVSDISELAQAEQRGDVSRQQELDALLAEAQIFFAGLIFPKNIIARAPRLQWVQTLSAGVDRYLDDEFRQSPVILTNVSGMHATPIGEFIIELMLMFAKGAPSCFDLKREKQWKRFTTTVLRSKTVGIVGLGHIGREAARLAKAFGMRVVATRRSARRVSRARYVDVLLPPKQLPRLLTESDFVVLSLALTPETRGLIGEKELRTMKPTAYLINIARGGLTDEEALIRALSENWIAGAGLDTFITEPLPADSRLWELPNVIFSPHIAGGMEDYEVQATEIFCENLDRYLNGKRLLRVVNKNRGY